MPLGRYYGAFAGNIPLQPGDFLLESAGDNITATPGGGQTGAFPINTQTARVTTVATANDSVMLPPSAPGLEVLIINHGNNPMQVFGYGTDQIDDNTSTVGVSQMQNSFVLYSCAAAGNWYSEGLATGFQRGTSLQTFSANTIAANATNTQASGTPVASMLVNVTAAANGSVTLPVSAPGLEITVHNISANTVSVFPNAGGTTTEKINALTANAAISLPTNTSTVFTCVTAGQWYTVPRVPS
ncbi:hypothetical protein [Ralstonia insidiosa]|uniref:hypothetical protein n=1 Tax=Ralstonia insidiosa TaxID=190721 RepID=UPI000CEE4EA6|nr:hypothetical protein [Ralstonia insidiosa]